MLQRAQFAGPVVRTLDVHSHNRHSVTGVENVLNVGRNVSKCISAAVTAKEGHNEFSCLIYLGVPAIVSPRGAVYAENAKKTALKIGIRTEFFNDQSSIIKKDHL